MDGGVEAGRDVRVVVVGREEEGRGTTIGDMGERRVGLMERRGEGDASMNGEGREERHVGPGETMRGDKGGHERIYIQVGRKESRSDRKCKAEADKPTLVSLSGQVSQSRPSETRYETRRPR
jgi:hypothetical protein